MKIKFCFSFLFLVLFFVFPSYSQVVYAKNRVIMVFADADQSQYKEQLKELKQNKYKKAWKERETVIYAETEDKKINWEQERKKRNLAQGEFAIILIGKDRGDKMINTEGIEAKELILIIDSMPMRRREKK